MRFVERVLDDGTVVVDTIPLTLEESLVPEEGDQVPESYLHEQWRTYLSLVFQQRLAADPAAVVLSDVRVEWGRPGVPGYTPDVAIMRGVREQREWRTFDLAEEGARPVLVIEITSPRTVENDRVAKRRAYAQVGVECYILIDTVSRRRQPSVRLVGYRRGAAGFEPLPPDARGWLWLAAVDLWLGLENGRPRLYESDGRPVPDYVEQAAQNAEQAALIAAQAARNAEQAALIAAQAARLAEVEAELRRLRGEELA
jgi:Uma2 family endonuclease